MNFTVVDCDTHFGVLPYRDTDVSLNKLQSSMGVHGIAAAMTYSLKGVMYDFEEGNDETLTAVRKHPCLLPIAVLDPRRHIGVLDEIDKRHKQGFVAVRVFPEQQGWGIDSVMFRPIARRLAQLDMPLMVTCAGNGAATAVLRAVGDLSLRVILCGVGYFNLAEAIAACMEYPSFFIEASVVDPPDSLAVAVDAIGSDRLIFGSNSPSFCLRSALNVVLEAPLGDEEKRKILSGNICRLLDIAPPAGVNLNLGQPFADIPIIDIHAHLGKWPFPMRGTGTDFILGLMKQRGISIAILSSSLGIVYDFVSGNSSLAQAIEDHPELLGYVTVNPNYFEASCRELDKYYGNHNFVGVKIHPAYSRQAINSPEMKTLVRAIAERGKPLLIHTYGPGTPSQALELALECPNLPIIMGHGGADAWREAAEVARRAENLYMEFCGTYHESDRVRRAMEIAGSEKILFGSDLDLIHPGFVAGTYEEANLTQIDKEKILYRNACRIFGISI